MGIDERVTCEENMNRSRKARPIKGLRRQCRSAIVLWSQLPALALSVTVHARPPDTRQSTRLKTPAAQNRGWHVTAPGLVAKDDPLIVGDFDGDGLDDRLRWSSTKSAWVYWRGGHSGTSRRGTLYAGKCPDESTRRVCWGRNQQSDSADAEWTLLLMDRGQPYQLLPMAGVSPIHGIHFEDVTGDGHADLVVAEGPCAGNCRSSIWPWHMHTRRFAQKPLLTGMANLRAVDPAQGIIESRVCGGQACAIFTARALEVSTLTVRTVAHAVQEDARPGSLQKRLRVFGADDRLLCESIVTPDDDDALDRCAGWPRSKP